MALVETIVSVLGGAVAKKIIGNWLKDNPLAEKIGEEIIDAIKDNFTDSDSARQTKHEIDKLGTEITTRIQTVLGVELQRLEPESLSAIAIEVTNALRTTVVTLPLLVQFNFDGNRLAHHITSSYPLKRAELSSDEINLYDRLLMEASQGIVTAAGQLRNFEVQSTRGILNRIDVIISYTTQQLESERREVEDFEQRYRKVIERELDRMETFGIPRMDSVTSRQKLSAAYITLSTTLLKDAHFDRQIALFSQAMITNGSSEKIESPLTESLAVTNALSQHRRYIIRAEAGAGKSTLLQWLAVRSATSSFPIELAHWNGTIPFFVRLRSLVGQRFPAMDQFPALLDQNFTDTIVPRGWVDQQMQSGRALVLIDGIDELPIQQRSEFFDSLRRLISNYPLACYIVTSRPSGLKDRYGESWQAWNEWADDEKFFNLNIERMSLSAIEQFVDRWHSALASANRPDDQRVDLVRMSSNLKRILRQRPELRRMSTTPLICAMICALHRERGETLPHERILLYEECISLLLSRRDEARRISLDDIYPAGLKDTHKRELIQSLAYWMLKNGHSSVSVLQTDHHFDLLVPQLRLSKEIDGSIIREFFVGRSGLLREPTIGNIDFAHRSFQEFLAAREAIDKGNIGILIDHADNDQWREVILVAASLARINDREELLVGLMKKGDNNWLDWNKRSYLHLLAVACLETSGRLDPFITEAAIARAKLLIPPKNEDEVHVIAAGGDEIVSLLQPDSKYSDLQSSICIKTLGLIGTSAALKLIAQYALNVTDESFHIISSLGQSWDNFDRLEYGERVLKYLPFLIFNNVDSPVGFASLTNAKQVYLELSNANDLTALKQLPVLEKLALNCPSPINLRSLAQIVGLAYLGLMCDDFGDLSWLKELHNLKGVGFGIALLDSLLIMGSRPDKFNLQQLVGLQIEQLSVAVTDNIDLTSITELTQLQTLQLSATSIQNLSELENLKLLRRLDIVQRRIDLSQFKDCKSLTHLSLGVIRNDAGGGQAYEKTKLRNFEVLQSFSNLRSLALVIRVPIDFRLLEDLIYLEELIIITSEIQDLTPLARLPNLRSLEIGIIIASNFDTDGFEIEVSSFGVENLKQLRDFRYSNSFRSKMKMSIQSLSSLNNLERITIQLDEYLAIEEMDTFNLLPKLQRLRLPGQHNIDLNELYAKPGLTIEL